MCHVNHLISFLSYFQEGGQKIMMELQQLSTNTAADIEEIRKKTYTKNA